MTKSTDLERRYRRLLALYPKAFRREREEEVVSVLMAGGRPGLQWPRPAESADLIRHSIPMRWRHPTDWARRHAGRLIVVRVGIGVWLVCLAMILAQYSLCGLSLLAPAALHFTLAVRVGAATVCHRAMDGPRSPGPLAWAATRDCNSRRPGRRQKGWKDWAAVRVNVFGVERRQLHDVLNPNFHH